MISQNEFYFKAQLMAKIEEWVEEELNDHDLGILPDNLVRNMTDAAWIVCSANKDLYDYLGKENMLTKD